MVLFFWLEKWYMVIVKNSNHTEMHQDGPYDLFGSLHIRVTFWSPLLWHLTARAYTHPTVWASLHTRSIILCCSVTCYFSAQSYDTDIFLSQRMQCYSSTLNSCIAFHCVMAYRLASRVSVVGDLSLSFFPFLSLFLFWPALGFNKSPSKYILWIYLILFSEKNS